MYWNLSINTCITSGSMWSFKIDAKILQFTNKNANILPVDILYTALKIRFELSVAMHNNYAQKMNQALFMQPIVAMYR